MCFPLEKDNDSTPVLLCVPLLDASMADALLCVPMVLASVHQGYGKSHRYLPIGCALHVGLSRASY